MRILVFGKTGQVATELQRYGSVTALSRGDADLSDPVGCAAIITETEADVIINAAAYTGVDAAETDTEMAYRVNSEAPIAMAEAAAKRALPFLHISTDYIFDGTGCGPLAASMTPQARLAFTAPPSLRVSKVCAALAAHMRSCAPLGWSRRMAIILSKPCCVSGPNVTL